MRTREELLAEIGKYGLGDAQYKAAQAELEMLNAQEYLAILQKTRENVYEVLTAMNSQIQRFRDVVDQAATDASMTSRALLRWNKLLTLTSVGLVLATLGLVYATFAVRH
jgi:hypothetical protein